MEPDYLSWGRLDPEWHLLPHIGHAVFHCLDQQEVDLLASSPTNKCQHYYTLENPIPLGPLGLNTFNYPRTYHVSYVFPSPTLVTLDLSKFLTKYVTGQFRFLLMALCCMEAPWPPTVLTMKKEIPHWCPMIRRSCHECVSRLDATGSVIAVFCPLAAQRCVLCRQGFSSSVF